MVTPHHLAKADLSDDELLWYVLIIMDYNTPLSISVFKRRRPPP